MRSLLLTLCFAPLSLLAQSDEYTQPDGISNLAYVSGRAVVTETTDLPDFLDLDVAYVEARVLGQADTFASLRFTRRAVGSANANGYAPPTASIPRNEIAAAASQLQLALDELLASSPERPTTFAYRASEGFGIVGGYEDGKWRLAVSLDIYGQGGDTAITLEQLVELVELIRSVSERA